MRTSIQPQRRFRFFFSGAVKVLGNGLCKLASDLAEPNRYYKVRVDVAAKHVYLDPCSSKCPGALKTWWDPPLITFGRILKQFGFTPQQAAGYYSAIKLKDDTIDIDLSRRMSRKCIAALG